jgi:sulfur transfer complex TusBCD TusB component (DsrH family)
LDDATLDCVYLCLERDAVLLTEDAGLRRSVIAVGITNSVNVQPVLMAALDEDLISHAQYVDAMSSKIERNQEFINLRSADLLYMVGRNPGAFDPAVTAALNTMRGPQLDLPSAVHVTAEMLLGMVELVSPKIFRQYFSAALDALASNRPQQAAPIQNALAHAVHSRISQLPKPLRLQLSRTMGALLQIQPMEQPQMLLRSPIALAVAELIRRISED